MKKRLDFLNKILYCIINIREELKKEVKWTTKEEYGMDIRKARTSIWQNSITARYEVRLITGSDSKKWYIGTAFSREDALHLLSYTCQYLGRLTPKEIKGVGSAKALKKIIAKIDQKQVEEEREEDNRFWTSLSFRKEERASLCKALKDYIWNRQTGENYDRQRAKND